MIKIYLIAAMSDNRIIGNKGRLPWGHLPADWDNLFRITEGYVFIMGRKSYDTPDRVASKIGNVVVTRQAHFPLEKGFDRADSLTNALKMVENRGIETGLSCQYFY